MAMIDIQDVSRRFEHTNRSFLAITDVSLRIDKPEVVSIVGPSGCGKSTVLNMIAGLLEPTSGTVRYRGAAVPMPNTAVGYMTQKESLFPWRTVLGNVSLPLRIRGASRAEARARAMEMIKMVNLDGFESAFPAELSGGMRKRAMLARTLAYFPEVLLADEPFGALDAHLKLQMQQELLDQFERVPIPMVFVTHDLAEAVTLADRVIVISRAPGTVRLEYPVDIDRPRDVYKIRNTPEYQRIYDDLWRAMVPDMIEEGR